MVKEILACILLTTCTNNHQIIKTHKNGWLGNTYVCTGQYTFKDEFDFTNYENYNDPNKPMGLAYVDFNPSPNQISIFGCVYDDTFKMHEIEEGLITLYLQPAQGNRQASFSFITTSENTETITVENTNNISNATQDGDFYDSVRNFVINFNSDYYLTGYKAVLFNCIFTQAGNRYVNTYTGYYHYNNGSWLNNNYDFEYAGSTFIVDNVVYNAYNHDSTNVQYVNTNTLESVNFYQNFLYVKNGNVYLTGLLPYYVKECMNSEGAFTYVPPEQHETTFQEFFFGIVDAPLYYIWSLFNWELFGLNLFVAFCSLVTMALIIAIVKKVA